MAECNIERFDSYLLKLLKVFAMGSRTQTQFDDLQAEHSFCDRSNLCPIHNKQVCLKCSSDRMGHPCGKFLGILPG